MQNSELPKQFLCESAKCLNTLPGYNRDLPSHIIPQIQIVESKNRISIT